VNEPPPGDAHPSRHIHQTTPLTLLANLLTCRVYF